MGFAGPPRVPAPRQPPVGRVRGARRAAARDRCDSASAGSPGSPSPPTRPSWPAPWTDSISATTAAGGLPRRPRAGCRRPTRRRRAEARRRGPPRRPTGWRPGCCGGSVGPSSARAAGRSGVAYRELAAGAAALSRHRGHLGSLDLQTGAAVHGREIIAAGLGAALRGGAVRTIYRWSELSRAQALLLPPATPPTTPPRPRPWRNCARCGWPCGRRTRRPARGRRCDGGPRRWSGSLREHSWSAAAPRGRRRTAGLAPAVRAELGDAAMVVYLPDGPRLHALVVTARRTRLVPLGGYAAVVETVRRLRADLDAQVGRRCRPASPPAVAAPPSATPRRWPRSSSTPCAR